MKSRYLVELTDQACKDQGVIIFNAFRHTASQLDSSELGKLQSQMAVFDDLQDTALLSAQQLSLVSSIRQSLQQVMAVEGEYTLRQGVLRYQQLVFLYKLGSWLEFGVLQYCQRILEHPDIPADSSLWFYDLTRSLIAQIEEARKSRSPGFIVYPPMALSSAQPWSYERPARIEDAQNHCLETLDRIFRAWFGLEGLGSRESFLFLHHVLSHAHPEVLFLPSTWHTYWNTDSLFVGRRSKLTYDVFNNFGSMVRAHSISEQGSSTRQYLDAIDNIYNCLFQQSELTKEMLGPLAQHVVFEVPDIQMSGVASGISTVLISEL